MCAGPLYACATLSGGLMKAPKIHRIGNKVPKKNTRMTVLPLQPEAGAARFVAPSAGILGAVDLDDLGWRAAFP
jgi:hypothetical protein